MSPMITSDGAGGAIVTWYDRRSGSSYHIYTQRVNASGTVQWTSDGVALCTAAGDQGYPTIVSDDSGGAIVAWYGGTNHDIYAQRVNASGVVQWTTDGVALCTAAGDQGYPTIVSDDSGGAIVAWVDERDQNYDIYAQRVNASGVVQWTTDGVALCTAARDQFSPTITSDGTGGAIVTWDDKRSGGDDHVYAQRVDVTGAVRWTTDGVALYTARGLQYSPTIASDSAGGAIVTWFDTRSGNNDIYAQRVDADGFMPLLATVPMELHQNYPNPFNPATTVTYSIAEKGDVTLAIYDVSGKCIARLVDRQQEKGSYAVEWSGKDTKGSSVASGIYFYQLTAGNQTISRKMVLLR